MTRERYRILILGDPSGLPRRLARFLGETHEIVHLPGDESVDSALQHRRTDLILLDLDGARGNGDSARRPGRIAALRKKVEGAPILAVCGKDRPGAALQAIQEGAYDALTSPVAARELRFAVRRALEHRLATLEIERLESEREQMGRFPDLHGVSPAMARLRSAIQAASEGSSPVILHGERGTGRRMAARSIHESSGRHGRPLIVLEAGGPDTGRLDTAIFGAAGTPLRARPRSGAFTAARGGSILVHAAGRLDARDTGALLRAARSGSAAATERDGRPPRLLISTGHDLREKSAPIGGAHRDLLSMSAVIEIPPLRERKEDILLLAAHFLARRCRTAGRAAAGLSPEAQIRLLTYPWPGNVREMEEVVSEARLSPGEPVLSAEHLPPRLRELPGPGVSALPSIPEEGILWQKQVESFERGLLQQALDMSHGKKVEAAQRLGLNKDQMKYLCRKYGY